MSGGNGRKLLTLAAIGAAVAFVAKALRGDPAPAFSNHPSVDGGFRPLPVDEPTTDATPAATSAPITGPADEVVPPVEPDPAPEPAVVDEPEVTAADTPITASSNGTAWVEPVDGACPDGYPVKAKLKSGLFHLPGMLAYDRTNPDRCYPSAEAAEADGLRAAKR